VVMYSDGVDECIYEVPTISATKIAQLIRPHKLASGIAKLIDQIYSFGAEDNLSMVVYQHQWVE